MRPKIVLKHSLHMEVKDKEAYFRSCSGKRSYSIESSVIADQKLKESFESQSYYLFLCIYEFKIIQCRVKVTVSYSSVGVKKYEISHAFYEVNSKSVAFDY